MEEIGRTAVKKEPLEEQESYKSPSATVSSSQAIAEPPVNLVDLEERILQLCADNPKGISEEVIKSDQPQLDAERRLKALERLLTQGKIKIEQLKKDSSLIYKLRTASSTHSKTKGFEKEERLVYQIIEDSGNKGIWTRDIRSMSNLGQAHLTKILKTLESKKLVKLAKSVQASKKKVYMLYNLTPDVSLTGGAFYSDQGEFESEFVEVLSQRCLKFLEQKEFKARSSNSDPMLVLSASLCSSQEVFKFITELGISKVQLTNEDIVSILDTLVYDGSAEVEVSLSRGDRVSMEMEEKGEETQRFYRVSKAVFKDTGFNRIPCGICPVINQCCDEGIVSPQTCVYMKKWLQF